MWLDATRYTIPNWLVGLLLILYPVAVLMSPAAIDWQMGLAAAAVLFVAGFIVFLLKLMGAGDIKLIAAIGLWIGWGQNLIDYIVYMTLLGGLLAIGLWLGRKILPFVTAKKQTDLPRILREGAPVPYGLAIASAFLIMLYMGRIAAAI